MPGEPRTSSECPPSPTRASPPRRAALAAAAAFLPVPSSPRRVRSPSPRRSAVNSAVPLVEPPEISPRPSPTRSNLKRRRLSSTAHTPSVKLARASDVFDQGPHLPPPVHADEEILVSDDIEVTENGFRSFGALPPQIPRPRRPPPVPLSSLSSRLRTATAVGRTSMTSPRIANSIQRSPMTSPRPSPRRMLGLATQFTSPASRSNADSEVAMEPESAGSTSMASSQTASSPSPLAVQWQSPRRVPPVALDHSFLGAETSVQATRVSPHGSPRMSRLNSSAHSSPLRAQHSSPRDLRFSPPSATGSKSPSRREAPPRQKSQESPNALHNQHDSVPVDPLPAQKSVYEHHSSPLLRERSSSAQPSGPEHEPMPEQLPSPAYERNQDTRPAILTELHLSPPRRMRLRESLLPATLPGPEPATIGELIERAGIELKSEALEPQSVPVPDSIQDGVYAEFIAESIDQFAAEARTQRRRRDTLKDEPVPAGTAVLFDSRMLRDILGVQIDRGEVICLQETVNRDRKLVDRLRHERDALRVSATDQSTLRDEAQRLRAQIAAARRRMEVKNMARSENERLQAERKALDADCRPRELHLSEARIQLDHLQRENSAKLRSLSLASTGIDVSDMLPSRPPLARESTIASATSGLSANGLASGPALAGPLNRPSSRGTNAAVRSFDSVLRRVKDVQSRLHIDNIDFTGPHGGTAVLTTLFLTVRVNLTTGDQAFTVRAPKNRRAYTHFASLLNNSQPVRANFELWRRAVEVDRLLQRLQLGSAQRGTHTDTDEEDAFEFSLSWGDVRLKLQQGQVSVTTSPHPNAVDPAGGEHGLLALRTIVNAM